MERPTASTKVDADGYLLASTSKMDVDGYLLASTSEMDADVCLLASTIVDAVGLLQK
jgi:hypothetical protein